MYDLPKSSTPQVDFNFFFNQFMSTLFKYFSIGDSMVLSNLECWGEKMHEWIFLKSNEKYMLFTGWKFSEIAWGRRPNAVCETESKRLFTFNSLELAYVW